MLQRGFYVCGIKISARWRCISILQVCHLVGQTLRVLGKSGYVYYLSMTSNNGFLEDGVCAVLFPDDILL